MVTPSSTSQQFWFPYLAQSSSESKFDLKKGIPSGQPSSTSHENENLCAIFFLSNLSYFGFWISAGLRKWSPGPVLAKIIFFLKFDRNPPNFIQK